MAELATLARPYARAAFEQAQANPGGLARWSAMLNTAAMVVADAQMTAFIKNPQLDMAKKVELIVEICGDALDEAAHQFLLVLGKNGRLLVLPTIVPLYEQLRADAEKSVTATLVSAMAVPPAQVSKLEAALSKKLQRTVTLTVDIDPTLIGGAVIRAGDLVIDGSARGRLAHLDAALRL